LSVRTTLFFAGAGLGARASGADVRGATYFLDVMVGRWSKAKACVGEMTKIGTEGGEKRGDMASNDEKDNFLGRN
jgi:hypothetical protein